MSPEANRPDLSVEDILATMPDGMALVDVNLTLLEVNPAMEVMVGRSRSRLVGQPLKKLFPQDERLPALAERCLSTGRTANDFERPLARSGHPPEAVWVTATPLLDKDGSPEGVLLVVRDFGKLHSFQEQMRRADRLSSLGVLAAGLAHEIRNPLGGIKGAAQLLAQENPSAREYIDIVVREAERIDDLMGQLLALSRPPTLSLTRINIHQLLDDVLTLQRETVGGGEVRFEQLYDPSIPLLEADPAQLTQVLLNLVKNAMEVSPSGGTIKITTRMATELAIPASAPGGRAIPFVCIEVADTGPGIAPDVKEHIFTPFFTTKTDGSGLGLSVANGIVEQHGGRLELTNGPEGGAVARCYLPVEQPPTLREAP
ncbi:MAG: PAS domain-containing protein [Nitrospinae bacterium]|nr:PAS domain-containing protein [Nitrospinota bacterium]